MENAKLIIEECLQYYNTKNSTKYLYDASKRCIYDNIGEIYCHINTSDYLYKVINVEYLNFQIEIKYEYLSDLLPIIFDKLDVYHKILSDKDNLMKDIRYIYDNQKQYVRDIKINKLNEKYM